MKPYEYFYVEEKVFYYLFESDYGIVYELKFKPSDYLFGVGNEEISNKVYEFVIGILENPTIGKIPSDVRIGDTVAVIFNDFFKRNNDNVAIYICDSSDLKQEVRMKKFQQWYYKYQDSTLIKMDEVLIDTKNNRFPISIIAKRTNPYLIEIFTAFATISDQMNEEK